MKKRNYADGNNYMEMLFAINSFYSHKKALIVIWKNRFEIKCFPILGIEETSMEPDDEDYYGEYYTFVEIIEVLTNVENNFFPIKNVQDYFFPQCESKKDKKFIELNIFNIPERIMLEDGTLLWQFM
ncbi:MAG: hypothetical protein FWE02_06630 [Defluviitaleaceae bacterium]|nr:hypothetical protein [Defluviitaleaceae bacterium]